MPAKAKGALAPEFCIPELIGQSHRLIGVTQGARDIQMAEAGLLAVHLPEFPARRQAAEDALGGVEQISMPREIRLRAEHAEDSTQGQLRERRLSLVAERRDEVKCLLQARPRPREVDAGGNEQVAEPIEHGGSLPSRRRSCRGTEQRQRQIPAFRRHLPGKHLLRPFGSLHREAKRLVPVANWACLLVVARNHRGMRSKVCGVDMFKRVCGLAVQALPAHRVHSLVDGFAHQRMVEGVAVTFWPHQRRPLQFV